MKTEEQQICDHIQRDFPKLFRSDLGDIPESFGNPKSAKVIILGADPSFSKLQKGFETVFDLSNAKSPFFKSIQKNLSELGLSRSEIYVQNLVRNYFWLETSKNREWLNCAKYWIPFTRKEFDSMFSLSIPVFVTASIILKALIDTRLYNDYPARRIYKEIRVFSPDENVLNRTLICLFRHHKYDLSKNKEYAKFLRNYFGKTGSK